MIKKILSIFLFVFLSLIVFSLITGNKHLVLLTTGLSTEQKNTIKKYLLPYKLIKEQEYTVERLSNIIQAQERTLKSHDVVKAELDFKNSKKNIKTSKKTVDLNNGFSIEKIIIEEGFYSGINLLTPGSGFIDFYQNKLFVMSSKGIITYLDSDNQLVQVQNNLNEFLNYKSLSKKIPYGKSSRHMFSFKDMTIIDDNIFASYTEEQQENCWNTSLLKGKIDLKNIKFEKIFSPSQCIHTKNNLDNEFNAHQSGGRIIKFDDESILFTIGEYRSRFLAQDKKSVNGKIIKINLNNNSYQIISMGHRNPQGLYYDNEREIIIETEHGPFGGDEINIIKLDKIYKNETQNFGWPVSSAGEHYGGKTEKNKVKYEKYPLHKSHKDHGFIEPIKSFVPSIGISEVVKLDKEENLYLIGSMKEQTLFFVSIDDKKNFRLKEKIRLGERIRDIKLHNNKIYLFLENSASIGIMSLPTI